MGITVCQVLISIFAHHNAIIHDYPDGQCDTGKRHDIRGYTKSVEQDEADGNGDGNLNNNAQRTAPVKQKDDNDQ